MRFDELPVVIKTVSRQRWAGLQYQVDSTEMMPDAEVGGRSKHTRRKGVLWWRNSEI